MDIVGLIVPHARQRYPTTGDYWTSAERKWDMEDAAKDRERVWLNVRVSKMPDARFEDAVMVHEIFEALLCKHAGIDEPTQIKVFDELYEQCRPSIPVEIFDPARTALHQTFGCTCEITETSEPGDDKHSPYHRQHQLATAVERIFIAETGASWMEYEQANLDLYE